MNDNWHSYDKEELFKELNTSIDGLTSKEANDRLLINGRNVLPHGKRDTILQMFFRQFMNPIVIILLITIVLSMFIGEVVDAVFIIIVVFLDASLGTYQEGKASKNAVSLQNLIKVNANVLRDNDEVVIDSNDIVVGDIVNLNPGDKVPADIRLISAYNLATNESILTGESTASNKNVDILNERIQIIDRKNMVYGGTTVIRGRGVGVVVSTGINTEIGNIANTVLLIDNTKTPLVSRMEKFTKQIGVFTAIIGVILAVILYYRGYLPKEIFLSVIALSVSAIPEGLPVALTLALSIASNRMLKKNVIVKKLNAVESLGSCTIIASDKTGTLTLNEQNAKIMVLPDGEKLEIKDEIHTNEQFKTISKLGVINNEASLELKDGKWVSYGDSIDIGFLSLGNNLNVDVENMKILGQIPYESLQKYSSVFYEENGKYYCTVKGSLEKILEFSVSMKCNGSKEDLNGNLLREMNENLAKEGYRVIAIASGEVKDFVQKEVYEEKDIPKLTVLGMIGFIDPVREEVIESIEKCIGAGIRIVMITGDHPTTAFHVASKLGMAKDYSDVITGSEIDKLLESGYKKLDEVIKTKTVFARVNPTQKYEIIESYKRQGEFVAVTGDGVNDAPALKSANIGISLGSGTDVAKETASMIIVDDNFMSIVSGVEEGRNAYNNVRKVIYMLLSTGLAEVLFFILSVLFNYPIPLLAVQLLWLNLVTDGIQDAALAFEKSEPGIMENKPRKPKEKIFNKILVQETLISGIFTGLLVFIVWIYLLDYKQFDVVLARSYIIILMVFIQNIQVFNCRSETISAFKLPFKNNPFVVLSVIVVLVLQFLVVNNAFFEGILKTSDVPLNHVFVLITLCLPLLLIMEIFKYFKRRNKKLHNI